MRHRRVRPLVLKLTLLIAAAAAATSPATAAIPFISETVETSGLVGQYSSLALGHNGSISVSYYDATNGDLKFATKTGATWISETVASAGQVGTYTSLVLDASGNPWITYRDETNGDLKLACKNGGVWTIETVDATGDVGAFTSLALTGQGAPRIAYQDVANFDLKYASKSGAVWSVVTVDAICSGTVSLALDVQDNPYISYWSGAGGLKTAWKPAGNWLTETVDATTGAYNSIALDATRAPRISYYDEVNDNLKYASKTGGTWVLEIVESAGDVGRCTSLALDPAGNPRISYYGDSCVRYASKVGSTWTVEPVIFFVDPLNYYGTSLKLDHCGNPCISAYDANNGDLWISDSGVHLLSPAGGERWSVGSEQMVRWSGGGSVSIEISPDGGLTYSTLVSGVYEHQIPVVVPQMSTEQARIRVTRTSPYATSAGGACFLVAPGLVSPWWRETVDGTTHAVISLALDAEDVPCLAYMDYANHDLKFARRSGGGWIDETVDATGWTGFDVALDLDAEGNPHISYVDDTSDDLKYARRSDGAWVIETVDAGQITGLWMTSLALDSGGDPWITYCDNATDDLMLARKQNGSWTTQTVDATGLVGTYSSLCLDAFGEPCVSYYDQTITALKYAQRVAGSWNLETVDSNGSVGSWTSLDLDPDGNPCIAYYDLTKGDLKFAAKEDGSWRIEVVDSQGDVGFDTDLLVDGQGNPWITYYDNDNDRVKLARRSGGIWIIEELEGGGTGSTIASLALDAHGNPHIGYRDANQNLCYGSAAIELGAPAPGVVWPVGAARTVTWSGTGRVDLYLSVDGGATWDPLASGLAGGVHRMDVPHAPTRFAKIKLVRPVPASEAIGSGLFTIETSIELLGFQAKNPPGSEGVELSWSTDPGPEDLAGYRLERNGPTGSWSTLLDRTRATSYVDQDGGAESRYRLTAINGFGDELHLGDVSATPLRPLSAWPLPYSGGELQISFATAGALGGGPGNAELALYDAAGRFVKSIASGRFAPGHQRASWDGRDEQGHPVPGGIYFLRTQTEGRSAGLKLTVFPR